MYRRRLLGPFGPQRIPAGVGRVAAFLLNRLFLLQAKVLGGLDGFRQVVGDHRAERRVVAGPVGASPRVPAAIEKLNGEIAQTDAAIADLELGPDRALHRASALPQAGSLAGLGPLVQGDGAGEQVGPARASEAGEVTLKEDYWGQPELIEVARQWVSLLEDPSRLRAMGGQPVTGVLLSGPPGSGCWAHGSNPRLPTSLGGACDSPAGSPPRLAGCDRDRVHGVDFRDVLRDTAS